MIAALAVAGCGDDVQPGCDPDVPCGAADTGSGEGDGGSASGTSNSASGAITADASSSADGSAGTDSGATVGSTSGESSGTATMDGDTTGSSTGGESEGTSSGGQGNVEYSAQALVGALDRILVFKEDLDADRCTWIVLVSPAIGGAYDVTTPANWSVEQIEISDVGDACGSPSPGMFGAEAATSAEGTIELGAIGGTGVYPCDVSVDVTAMFAGLLPGIPPSDLLDADAIPVTGC